MTKTTLSKVIEFITNDIWYVKLEKFPKWQRNGIRLLRISILAVKDYSRKKLGLRASALTLYTLMSIVPVFAMVFGIAHGFGLETYLDKQLREWFSSQPMILENVINYTHNLLGSTKGGIVAGFGFLLLLWSVVQVLSNIEDTFNSIWYVTVSRTWARKFIDYLSIMLLSPILIIISGAANIFITTQVQNIVTKLSFLGTFVTESIIISLQVLPYITTSLLFTFLYLVMPNIRVKPKAAIVSGIIAGSVFQIFQWGYIAFQVGVSRYNAIYGSFASIPLFITWLQFSWMIVLIGAEISYSVQNIATFQAEQQNENISHKMRMLYSIYILHYIAKCFKNATPPPDIDKIATRLQLPASLCKQLLTVMQKCNLVVKTSEQEKNKENCYVPAVDISKLTLSFIINRLESMGELKKHESEILHQIKINYIKLEEAMELSNANKNILDF